MRVCWRCPQARFIHLAAHREVTDILVAMALQRPENMVHMTACSVRLWSLLRDLRCRRYCLFTVQLSPCFL
jgi:hypothetical protein